MKKDRCALCRNEADFSYDVDPANPRRLCNPCFGKYEPKELDALLGVVQFHPEKPKTTSVTFIRKPK